jgi:GT2 family glycosyltransferase
MLLHEMSAKPAVSVVIPTYRRRASLERALSALARQTLPATSYEVIVSIDGSEDGTREMVGEFRAPFSLRALWQPNSGSAAARNAGAREAVGELLVFLDDDMEPAPECLAGHADAHLTNLRQAVLGAVPVCADEASPPTTQYMAERFRRHLAKLSSPGHEIGPRDVYSMNFSIRKEVFLEVGLFDESFRIYGNEDVELAIRLLAAGVRFVYAPAARAWQHCEKDFDALAREKTAAGRTSVACALLHPDAVPRLRIGTYRGAGRKWRLMRGALVAASRPLQFLPGLVTGYVKRCERRALPSLHSQYELALDYFYWLGVRAELRERPGATRKVAL